MYVHLSRFYSRWKEAELALAHAQGFSLDEEQLKTDWSAILALADQKGKSLEQAHIFTLAHILKRPVVVYGVKMVKNYRGENLGFVNFEGTLLYADCAIFMIMHSCCCFVDVCTCVHVL